MEENTEKQLQLITEKFVKINKTLFEEWKLKYPSPYRLESSASEIMRILRDTKIDNKDFSFWKSWRIRDLDIFLADLDGELGHDYDKRLVRYRAKWTKEKDKIDNLISDFKQKFEK
jgi:thymidylate synthase